MAKKRRNDKAPYIIILAFLILVSIFNISCLAEDNGTSYYSKEYLDMNVDISNSLQITPETSGYILESVLAEITFFPKNDFRQEVSELETEPEAEISDDMIEFLWDNPKEKTLTYKIKSNVRASGTLKEVRSRIAFPIRNYDEEYKEYIVETATVDFKDRKIVSVANDLATGEDDLYSVVHKYGEWIKRNIEYDMNTMTAEATQKASWVLENRKGVCDEITNLFIAMCRSVGIPARFVSGLSYTNSEMFSQGWSPHGWSEVYFPGHGWVPFDVTFGELGYVDATHIALKQSDDANKSSSRYEWMGRDVELNSGSIEMEANIIDMGPAKESLADISAMVAYDEICFGSYNTFEVTLKNRKDYYAPVEVSISKTKEIHVYDDYRRLILLKPGEEKVVRWIFKLDDNLDSMYKYKFVISARVENGEETEVKFSSAQIYPKYSLEEIREHISSAEKEVAKTYSREVELSCYPEKEEYLVGEDAKITCAIKNNGNIEASGITSCLLEDCRETSLRIGEEAFVVFTYPVADEGSNKVTIKSENEDISKTAVVIINAWAEPVIEIESVTFPEEVKYAEGFKIEFLVKRGNNAPVEDVYVLVECPGISKAWEDVDMTTDKRFLVNVAGKIITEEESDCSVLVTYTDSLEKSHSAVEDFTINVKEISFLDRIMIWLSRLVKKFMVE